MLQIMLQLCENIKGRQLFCLPNGGCGNVIWGNRMLHYCDSCYKGRNNYVACFRVGEVSIFCSSAAR